MNNLDINKIQKFVSICAISSSVLRNQGKGVVKKAQNFCAEIDLGKYSGVRQRNDFIKLLDKDTEKLLNIFGLRKRPWGAARKAINLFLRDSLYNKYLCSYYKLEQLEQFLEVPLDSAVSKGLKKRGKRGELPLWPGLKSLTKTISDKYQQFAQEKANQLDIYKVHLDIDLWMENR